MPEPLGVELLRHIAQDPGPWVANPDTAAYAAQSGPQALDYACTDPWLRLMLALSYASSVRRDADVVYDKYYQVLVNIAYVNPLSWYRREEQLNCYGCGESYKDVLAAACFLHEQRDILIPIARACTLTGILLRDFIHAALGEWCAALLRREYHDHHALMRRISADGRCIGDTFELYGDAMPYVGEVAEGWYNDCEPLRYDPSEVYDSGYGSICDSSIWPAVKLKISGSGESAWAGLELLTVMKLALDDDPKQSLDFVSSWRFDEMMRLAQVVSGRP